MGKGRFTVSFELLVDVLHLPEDTEILDVDLSIYPPRAVHVVVEHPDIPAVTANRDGLPEGVLLNPTFETDYDGGKTEYAVKFIGWN